MNSWQRDARCIRCGCTDSHACPGGCGWVVVDRRRRLGICSKCPRGESERQLRRALRLYRVHAGRSPQPRVRRGRQGMNARLQAECQLLCGATTTAARIVELRICARCLARLHAIAADAGMAMERVA